MTISSLVASFAFCAWLYLICLRGGFWRLTERDDELAPPEAPAPRDIHVIAVVPARDEADVIAQSLSSLLAQEFSGRFEIVLVDDRSADGTGAIAESAALSQGASDRLTILKTGEPPSGWTGKLAAMQHGFQYVRALPRQPDFILFCDADIGFDPPLLERLVKGALARDTTLTSLMVKLRCESLAERWFVPAFVFFFQMLYPFAWVNNRRRKTAAAAGGVMLVRPEALARAGGLEAIRGALIDDCALGALMKTQGPIWLGLTDSAHSLRAYPKFADIDNMVTRSAYAELHYSPLRLLGAILGMVVVYLAPPALAFFPPSPAVNPGLYAYVLMGVAYAKTLKFYHVPWIQAGVLPLVAACYTWFTLKSAIQYYLGRGGAWKGRYQAPSRTKGSEL